MNGFGHGLVRCGDGFVVSSVGGMLSKACRRGSGREAGRERKREIALVEWRRGGGCLESPPWPSFLFCPSDPGEDHDTETLLREPV